MRPLSGSEQRRALMDDLEEQYRQQQSRFDRLVQQIQACQEERRQPENLEEQYRQSQHNMNRLAQQIRTRNAAAKALLEQYRQAYQEEQRRQRLLSGDEQQRLLQLEPTSVEPGVLSRDNMCEEQQQQQQQHQEHTRQLSAAATAQIFTFTANIVDTASANIGPPAAPSNAVILLLLSDLILSETVSISILWKESWDRLKEMAIASSREKIHVSEIAVLFFVLPLSLLMLALLVN